MCGVLFACAATLAACLVVHILVWRIRRPVGYGQWLPWLMAIFLGVGPALAWWLAAGPFGRFDADTLDRTTAWMAILLLHGSVSAVYIIGYTLVSAFSPSIEILKLLERSPDGLPRAQIDLPYLRTALGGDRVRSLLDGGLIAADADDVRLGGQARMLTGLVLFYRHFIGLPDGAGG